MILIIVANNFLTSGHCSDNVNSHLLNAELNSLALGCGSSVDGAAVDIVQHHIANSVLNMDGQAGGVDNHVLSVLLGNCRHFGLDYNGIGNLGAAMVANAVTQAPAVFSLGCWNAVSVSHVADRVNKHIEGEFATDNT